MRRAAAALLLLAALACSRDGSTPSPGAAPVTPAAAVSIEPPRFRVGDVGTVEIAVVTPPGHRVAPIRPPAAVAGLWLLDAESLPVERSGAREIRRTRIRVRANEVGATEWPAVAVEIESPAGARATLTTEPRPLEVVSVLPVLPERSEPFSYRLPTANGPSPIAAAAAGAAGTLVLLAAIALARRVRRRSRARRSAEHASAAMQPWTLARAEIGAARALSDTEWRVSGAAGARALRRYLAQRFGSAGVASATSEELAALAPPFLRAQRWQEALACLRALDGDRFRAWPDPESARRVREALATAEEIVRATTPASEADPAERG